MKRLVFRVTLALCAVGLIVAPRAQADAARFAVGQCMAGAPHFGATNYATNYLTGSGASYANSATCASGGWLDTASSSAGAFTSGGWEVTGQTPGGFNNGVTFSYSANYNQSTGYIHARYWASLQGIQADPSGNWHTVDAGNSSSVAIELYCQSFSQCPGASNISARDFIFHTVDPHPPEITGETGTLLDPGTARGAQDLSVSASDQGGGIAALSVLVNGIEAGRKTTTCDLYGGFAMAFTPCPTSASASFDLNTEATPFHDGSNDVQVCVADYANEGNPGLTCRSHTVSIDNSCAGSAVPGGQNLSLKFKQTDSDTAVVDPNTAATVTGKLSDGSGNPVSGATLCVREQMLLPDEPNADVGTVRTDSDGEYTYTVGAGPNRRVAIGYRFNHTQIGRDGKYLAHIQPTLQIKPKRTSNHKRIRIWGDIPGPRSGGRIVVLQARYPHNRKWKTFLQAKTNEYGQYVSRYRFTATYRTTKYRFRAVVPTQDGYPYLDGASNAIKVKVRGG